MVDKRIDPEKTALSVGDVAKRSGIKVSTVHYYNAEGLITSWRNNGNQRRFSRDVLRRVALIKIAQRVGIPLEEIRQALSVLPHHRTPSKDDWQTLSNQWRTSLDEQIDRLMKLRNQMDECIGCGCLSLSQCPLRNPGDIQADC